MRLSEQQRRVIREAGLRHFGVVPLVFGSRVDDMQRGGDIDLYIDKPMDAATAHRCETQLWVELQKRLGEQKIDIVTARIGEERPIDRVARARAGRACMRLPLPDALRICRLHNAALKGALQAVLRCLKLRDTMGEARSAAAIHGGSPRPFGARDDGAEGRF